MGILGLLWRRVAGRRLGTVVVVTGISMNPTFSEGDKALVKPRAYSTGSPERFDIVVVRPPGVDREDIKRIVGLPGELVEIRSGSLWVDAETTEEPHVPASMPVDWLHAWGTMDDEYVVLGDNRDAPGISDSRRYGPLKRDAIIGPVTRQLT